MKRKALFFGLLMSVCLFLTSCGQALDTNTQVKNDTQSVTSAAKTQKSQIASLETSIEALPAVFQKEHAASPTTNLLDDPSTGVAKNIRARQQVYKDFQKNQDKQLDVYNRLTKVVKRDLSEMPNNQLKNLLSSMKISQLDHDTFDKFMQQTVSAESDFFASQTSSDISNEESDEAMNRLNQYYGALYQQAEIMQVNLNTVKANANKVLKALNK